MAIKQLSAFVENKQGSLADTVKIISDAGINIRAMSIADTKDFGILRMIVDDTTEAKALLGEATMVNTTYVIAVKMEDKPGYLCQVLKALEEAEINVEYCYAFTAKGDLGAYVVFRVDNVADAEKVLAKKGFDTLSEAEAKNL